MSHHAAELPSAFVLAHSHSRFQTGLLGLRSKITAIERQLLSKVHEDPRFAELPRLCVEHLQLCAFEGAQQNGQAAAASEGNQSLQRSSTTFITGTDEADSGAGGGTVADSGAGADSAGGPPSGASDADHVSSRGDVGAMDDAIAQAVVASAAKELVRLCLEDWEVEEHISKLNIARTQVQRLDKEKIDSHHAYMAEVQSLRDRCMRLERKMPIEFHIPVGDVIFYDPTAHLEPDVRELVKEIVEFKVREELANQTGMVDETPELKMKIKDLEKTIKQLQDRIKELEDEREKEPPKRNVVQMKRPVQEPPPQPKPVVQEARPPEPKRPSVEEDNSGLCRKCGGPLRDKIVEEKIVEKIVEVEKVVEVFKEGETKIIQDDSFPAWLKDDEETRRKKLQLKLFKNESAEMRGLARENARNIKALERGGPLPGADPNAPKKDAKAEQKQRTQMTNKMKDEIKAQEKRLKELDKEMEEIRFLDPGGPELMVSVCQTDPLPPPKVIEKIIEKEAEPVIIHKEAPAPVIVQRPPEEKKKKVEQEDSEEEIVVKKPKVRRVVEESDDEPPPKPKPRPKPKPEPEPAPAPTPAVAPPPPRPKPVQTKVETVVVEKERPKRQPRSLGPPPDIKGTGVSDQADKLVWELREEHNDCRTNGEEEELCDRMDTTTEKLQKLMGKIRQKLEDTSKDDLIARLQAENEQLRDKNQQLEVALNELGDKLREAQQALKDAGLGDLVGKIFKDVALDDVLNYKGINVWERLYADAMRRLRGELMRAVKLSGNKTGALAATLKHINKYGGGGDLELLCPHCGKNLAHGPELLTDQTPPAGQGHVSIVEFPPSDHLDLSQPLQLGHGPQKTPPAMGFAGGSPKDLGAIKDVAVRGRGYSPTHQASDGSRDNSRDKQERAAPMGRPDSARRQGDGIPGELLRGALPPTARQAEVPSFVIGEAIAMPAGMRSPQDRAVSPLGRAGTTAAGDGKAGPRRLASPEPKAPGLSTLNLGAALEPVTTRLATPQLPPPPPTRIQRGREREQEKERERVEDFGAAPADPFPDSVLRNLEVSSAKHSAYMEFPKRQSPIPNDSSRGFQMSPKQKLGYATLSGVEHDAAIKTGLQPLSAAGVSQLAAGLRTLSAPALPPAMSRSPLLPTMAGGHGGSEDKGTASAPQLGAGLLFGPTPNVILLGGSTPFPTAPTTSALGPAGGLVGAAPGGSSVSAVGRVTPTGGSASGGLAIGADMFRETGDLKRNLLEPVRLVKDSSGGHVSHGKMDRWASDEAMRLKRRAGHIQARSLPAPKLVTQGETAKMLPRQRKSDIATPVVAAA